jgi:hypothetical protein
MPIVIALYSFSLCLKSWSLSRHIEARGIDLGTAVQNWLRGIDPDTNYLGADIIITNKIVEILLVGGLIILLVSLWFAIRRRYWQAKAVLELIGNEN